jgi:type VI secretion system protein ImpB
MANGKGRKHRSPNVGSRVNIEYEVQVGNARKSVELPLVMGVLSNLSGNPVEPLPAVDDRDFTSIDSEHFDQRLKAMKPRVAFTVPNTLTGKGNLSVDITFESMDDFSPAAIARKTAGLRDVLEQRTRLKEVLVRAQGSRKLEEALTQILQDPRLKALASAEESEGTKKESTNG